MGHNLEGEGMKWEELTTPEAVLAAFEAGRHVEYTAFKKDDIDMPASNRPNSGGWVTAIQLSVEEIVDELRKGSYRALIEEPAIPAGFTPWHGGQCPEDARDVQTRVVFRSGSVSTYVPEGRAWHWRHYGHDADIIAYRVESAQPWDCSNCGQRNSSWADECGRCETPRAGSQPNVDENAPPDVEALAPEIQLALDYSRNFATAKPDIGTTEKVHILGLCDLLERTARRLSPQEPVGLIGTVDRIGEDEHGQPRIVIHVTREAIKALPENLIGKMVTVGRPQVDEAFERIAKSWDDCFYDDDLNGTSIGDRLRSDWLRLATALNPTNPETISHE
jgi:hypothetical protein